MEINDYILSYSHACNLGAKQIGNKAFNISFCQQAGFRVPEGIVVHPQVRCLHLRQDNLDSLFRAVEKHFTGTKLLIVRSSGATN